MKSLIYIFTALIISFLAIGCTTFKKPDRYIQIPEYGYLPVIDNLYGTDIMVSYIAYDWYPYDDSTPGNHAGSIGFMQRKSLPETEEEAIHIVEKNFALDRKVSTKEMVTTAVAVPVAIPLAIIFWAPGIGMVTGYIEQREAASTKRLHPARISNTENNKGTEQRITIRFKDPQGNPISDAEVLLLLSPIPFPVYADENGHRLFPNKASYAFHVSPHLAELLAGGLGAESAPRGQLTDTKGNAELSFTQTVQNNGESKIFVLFHKAGYETKAFEFLLSQILSGERVFNVIINKKAMDSSVGKLNPWIAAQRLDQQVKYYSREIESIRYSGLPSLPSIPWEEYESLVLTAVDEAPDYPVVQSAHFFYEIQTGQISEAKKHARFIDDTTYMHAVYGMNWERGLPSRW